MKKTSFSLKNILIIVVVLLAMKFGINIAYDNGYFSPDQWRYSYLTMSMQKIDTNEFKDILQRSSQDIYMIYVGRNTCPTCIESIDNVKNIFDYYEEVGKKEDISIKLCYFDTKQYNDSIAVDLRKSLGIDYIPTIVATQNKKVFLFDSDNFALSDCEDVFKESILKTIKFEEKGEL